jgi:ATP-dependent Clp protease ATP-binding subunit ClpX
VYRHASRFSTRKSGVAAARPLLAGPHAAKIVEHLNAYVVGQTVTKKILAVAVHSHYKRLMLSADAENDVKSKIEHPADRPDWLRQNLMARTLARALRNPVCHRRCHDADEAGYVGERRKPALAAARRRLRHRVAAGILFIDEIDKSAEPARTCRSPRRVGEGVQQAALMLEGTVANVRQGRKHPNSIHSDGHHQYPVHLRRDVRGPRKHHRQTAR